ncbi:MAG: type II toxin-antitoxin system RelE/ParE family toxin [Cytophagales bacterium]|jgi:plasmid stabilization system protein ParE|nr:type II toxin-antitoxin system RelE/ParE family toxin [Cytophagales bacterium]
MTVSGKEPVFKQSFLDALYEIQQYLESVKPKKGHHFVDDLFDFCFDTIVNHPFAGRECEWKATPDKAYRRAVFKKDYLVVYKVTDTQVILLLIYHTSRDPSNLRLEND